MIQCDTCAEWYHGACVDVSESQAPALKTYACPVCAPSLGAASED
jgi:hypothetical protein